MSDVAGFATPPADMPKAQRGWGGLVVALAIGLAAGGGGVGLAWGLSGGEPSGAAADAKSACRIVQSADRPDSEYQHWLGAAMLAKMAAKGDPEYQPLADSMFEAGLTASRTYEAKGPEFEEHARKARELCDAL